MRNVGNLITYLEISILNERSLSAIQLDDEFFPFFFQEIVSFLFNKLGHQLIHLLSFRPTFTFCVCVSVPLTWPRFLAWRQNIVYGWVLPIPRGVPFPFLVTIRIRYRRT